MKRSTDFFVLVAKLYVRPRPGGEGARNAERLVEVDRLRWMDARSPHRLSDDRRPDLAQPLRARQRGWTYCTCATIVAPSLSSREPALLPVGREFVRR